MKPTNPILGLLERILTGPTKYNLYLGFWVAFFLWAGAIVLYLTFPIPALITLLAICVFLLVRAIDQFRELTPTEAISYLVPFTVSFFVLIFGIRQEILIILNHNTMEEYRRSIEDQLEFGHLNVAADVMNAALKINYPLPRYPRLNEIIINLRMVTDASYRLDHLHSQNIDELVVLQEKLSRHNPISGFPKLDEAMRRILPDDISHTITLKKARISDSEAIALAGDIPKPSIWKFWSYAVPEVEDYFKNMISDPDSVVFEEWKSPRFREEYGRYFWEISFRVRYKNRLGGYEREWKKALIKSRKVYDLF